MGWRSEGQLPLRRDVPRAPDAVQPPQPAAPAFTPAADAATTVSRGAATLPATHTPGTDVEGPLAAILGIVTLTTKLFF